MTSLPSPNIKYQFHFALGSCVGGLLPTLHKQVRSSLNNVCIHSTDVCLTNEWIYLLRVYHESVTILLPSHSMMIKNDKVAVLMKVVFQSVGQKRYKQTNKHKYLDTGTPHLISESVSTTRSSSKIGQ